MSERILKLVLTAYQTILLKEPCFFVCLFIFVFLQDLVPITIYTFNFKLHPFETVNQILTTGL